MKDKEDYEKDLASIRKMMERSVKFISLSGLSGVLAGIYALAGSAYGYYTLYYAQPNFENYGTTNQDQRGLILQLEIVAVLVLLFSLGTGLILSARKAKKLGVTVWNATSKQLLNDLLIPLCSGGLVVIVLLTKEYFSLAVPMCLIFYGLALIQSSRNTYDEIKYLGFTEIILGLISALLPNYGLIFSALGFGVMHIIYGAVMYFRYEN
jgi:hypothetical protein